MTQRPAAPTRPPRPVLQRPAVPTRPITPARPVPAIPTLPPAPARQQFLLQNRVPKTRVSGSTR